MTEQQLRDKLHHAMDSKLSGVTEDPFLEARVLAQEKGETKIMKRFTLRTAVMVAVLILSTVCAAYAASSWGLIDYFRFSGSQVPQDFDSGYDQELTQEAGGLRFRIRDAYISGDVLVSLTEISRTDGEPALFLPSPVLFSPEKSLAILYKDRAEDITIGDYAQEKGLPILYAHSRFATMGGLDSGSGDMWMEDDRVMVYYSTTNNVHPENGQITLDWIVSWQDGQGQWQESSKQISLPAEEIETRTIAVNKGVEVNGVRVVMDNLFLRKTRLDVQMDYHYYIDQETPGDKEKIQDYAFRLIDPDTYSFLPEGALYPWVDESVSEDDGRTWFFVTHHTLALDSVSDTLYFQFLPQDAERGNKNAPILEVKIQ